MLSEIAFDQVMTRSLLQNVFYDRVTVGNHLNKDISDRV